MSGLIVRKPSCLECEFFKRYHDPLSKRTHGVTLRMGDQYCTGGKKYSLIKGKGNTVGDRCPKVKRPPELRVYCFKDHTAWYLHDMLVDRFGTEKDYTNPHNYALRYKGSSPVSAWEFAQLLDEGQDLPDLGTAVTNYEVVEIDDGITPYFFYKTDGSYKAILFDRDVAKKNKLKRAKDGATPGSEKE